MIKILLVDRNPYIRQGLQMYLPLQPDLIVVGETDNEQGAIKFAQGLTPDVIVMDIQTSTSDGLEVIRLLHESQPSRAVIILTLLDEQLNQEFAKQIGIVAFVSKIVFMFGISSGPLYLLTGIGVLPIAIFEFSLGVLLTLKGFNADVIASLAAKPATSELVSKV